MLLLGVATSPPLSDGFLKVAVAHTLAFLSNNCVEPLCPCILVLVRDAVELPASAVRQIQVARPTVGEQSRGLEAAGETRKEE